MLSSKRFGAGTRPHPFYSQISHHLPRHAPVFPFLVPFHHRIVCSSIHNLETGCVRLLFAPRGGSPAGDCGVHAGGGRRRVQPANPPPHPVQTPRFFVSLLHPRPRPGLLFCLLTWWIESAQRHEQHHLPSGFGSRARPHSASSSHLSPPDEWPEPAVQPSASGGEWR